MSLGEIVALGWVAERLTERRLHAAVGARVLHIDFEALLRRCPETMAEILSHFRLDLGPGFLDGLTRSPLFGRYSKDTTQAYSLETRAQVMNRSRRANAAEIRKGLDWLARLGKQHPAIAEVLG